MPYQSLTKTKLTWEQKVDRFASLYGPFTTTWDAYRSFTLVEGHLEVRWPHCNHDSPPLIDIDQKPSCACCGSKRPMSLRILTDRSGATHMVGEDCYFRMREQKQVAILGFVSPVPQPVAAQ